MAASATRTQTVRLPGPNGKIIEMGVITFDGDATVEVGTALSRIDGVTFFAAGSAGTDAMPSLDETVTNYAVNVSGGYVTVDVPLNSTATYFYQLIGV
jgi:hypothetical protein